MLRIRLTLSKETQSQNYTHQDLIHDALVNAWAKAGATTEMIVGEKAKNWTFAALGHHRGSMGYTHSLIVSTADMELSRYLTRLKATDVFKRRWDEHTIDFSAAETHIEPDPIFPQQTTLACLLNSPLVLKDKQKSLQGKKHWHADFKQCSDLNERINNRLSAIADRPVNLSVTPDSLYLRANPKHSILVQLKTFKNNHKSFVIGMNAPLVLQGNEDDLRLAWYAGIGEKTRNGFGCIGSLDRGIGR